MKGLKKIALASAIAAVSAGAQAELKALDDTTMGELTGQAGLTIDVETKLTLGEFMYKDKDSANPSNSGGAVVIQDIILQGNTNEGTVTGESYLDNFRLTLDIAGTGANAPGTAIQDNALEYGFSQVIGLATLTVAAGNADQDMVNAMNPALRGALGLTSTCPDGAAVSCDDNGLQIDSKRLFGDGDLVIHSGFTDPWQKGGGFAAYARSEGNIDWADAVANGIGNGTATFTDYTYAQSETIVSKSVDFNFSFEVLGLVGSTYEAGDAAATALGTLEKTDQGNFNGLDADTTTTTLISDLSINGYFGPSDFVITNRGNGFGTDNSASNGGVATYAWGDADSKIFYSRFISITDLDVYIDIAGVKIEDLQIHNRRGDQSSLFDNQSIGAGNMLGVNRFEDDITVNNSAHGFAHTMRDIYAVKDNVLNISKTFGFPPSAAWLDVMQGNRDLEGVDAGLRDDFYNDGIALDTAFKGDIDIPHLSFGNDGVSIGEIYLTDLEVHRTMVISAKR